MNNLALQTPRDTPAQYPDGEIHSNQWVSPYAEGPAKKKKKGRLWLNDGSCVRLRPGLPNHVWSFDFVQDRTADRRVYRTLNIIDEKGQS